MHGPHYHTPELPTPQIEILDSRLENSGQILDNIRGCRGYALYQNVGFILEKKHMFIRVFSPFNVLIINDSK